ARIGRPEGSVVRSGTQVRDTASGGIFGRTCPATTSRAAPAPAARTAGSRGSDRAGGRGCEDRGKVGQVGFVVVGRLGQEEVLVFGVLEPARLRDDRQIPAQLARDQAEARANLVQRQLQRGNPDLFVDLVAAGI